jgi:shikimate kinase
MNNIYLIGMMGSGKTSSGLILAKLLKVTFLDLDQEIVREASQSINEIFKTKGESHFRNMESELLARASKLTDRVVATGGGIVLNPENNGRMKETGSVIYLKTSLNTLWERVGRNKNRPLLQTPDPKKTLEELLLKRSSLYEATAGEIFLTDQKTPEAVALEIYKTCFEKK